MLVEVPVAEIRSLTSECVYEKLALKPVSQRLAIESDSISVCPPEVLLKATSRLLRDGSACV